MNNISESTKNINQRMLIRNNNILVVQTLLSKCECMDTSFYNYLYPYILLYLDFRLNEKKSDRLFCRFICLNLISEFDDPKN